MAPLTSFTISPRCTSGNAFFAPIHLILSYNACPRPPPVLSNTATLCATAHDSRHSVRYGGLGADKHPFSLAYAQKLMLQ